MFKCSVIAEKSSTPLWSHLNIIESKSFLIFGAFLRCDLSFHFLPDFFQSKTLFTLEMLWLLLLGWIILFFYTSFLHDFFFFKILCSGFWFDSIVCRMCCSQTTNKYFTRNTFSKKDCQWLSVVVSSVGFFSLIKCLVLCIPILNCSLTEWTVFRSWLEKLKFLFEAIIMLNVKFLRLYWRFLMIDKIMCLSWLGEKCSALPNDLMQSQWIQCLLLYRK